MRLKNRKKSAAANKSMKVGTDEQKDLIKGAAKTIGEPITVVRFVRIQLGAE